jgi:hypothetical protein
MSSGDTFDWELLLDEVAPLTSAVPSSSATQQQSRLASSVAGLGSPSRHQHHQRQLRNSLSPPVQRRSSVANASGAQHAQHHHQQHQQQVALQQQQQVALQQQQQQQSTQRAAVGKGTKRSRGLRQDAVDGEVDGGKGNATHAGRRAGTETRGTGNDKDEDEDDEQDEQDDEQDEDHDRTDKSADEEDESDDVYDDEGTQVRQMRTAAAALVVRSPLQPTKLGFASLFCFFA